MDCCCAVVIIFTAIEVELDARSIVVVLTLLIQMTLCSIF